MASSIVDEAIRMLSHPLSQPISELSLLQQSLLFGEISKISYYRPDIVWEAVSSVGFEEYEFFDRDGAQAYIVANEHDCVVVCRGTEPNEWNDIKADVNAMTVIAENAGRVHRGFKREVDDLWPKLEHALRKIKSRCGLPAIHSAVRWPPSVPVVVSWPRSPEP